VEGENLDDMLENHEDLLWGDGDGMGGGEVRSSGPGRFRPGPGIGIGADCVALDTPSWRVSAEPGRAGGACWADVADAVDVAVVVVGG
jgi:hypothetical protein